MIEEQVQVIEIIDNQIVLQAQTQSACGSCSASKGCGTSVLSRVVGQKFTRFQVDNNINAEVGDTLIVGISEDALLKGSLMMYVIPILGMLVFALLAEQYLQSMVNYRDLAIAGSGIFGLASGSLLSRWYFRRQASRQTFTPVVLRKIKHRGKL
jgi:sigma-E factor negative regulatory protein RseC